MCEVTQEETQSVSVFLFSGTTDISSESNRCILVLT